MIMGNKGNREAHSVNRRFETLNHILKINGRICPGMREYEESRLEVYSVDSVYKRFSRKQVALIMGKSPPHLDTKKTCTWSRPTQF